MDRRAWRATVYGVTKTWNDGTTNTHFFSPLPKCSLKHIPWNISTLQKVNNCFMEKKKKPLASILSKTQIIGSTVV